MEINIIRIYQEGKYKFNIETGKPENKLAKNLIKNLDNLLGIGKYLVVFNEDITFETILKPDINNV